MGNFSKMSAKKKQHHKNKGKTKKQKASHDADLPYDPASEQMLVDSLVTGIGAKVQAEAATGKKVLLFVGIGAAVILLLLLRR